MPAPKAAKSHSLDAIFDSLRRLFLRHAPPFQPTHGKIRAKRDLHLTAPHPVVIPGAYGGKPVHPDMASLILQKDYVGFYFMPVYMDPALKKKLSPSLVALLKGKSCFYIKKLDPELLGHIEFALEEGVKSFRQRRWLD
ncbi:MAG: hypothetical protein ACRD59_08380 [Candidatus Acidiferrales bacterium]